MSADILPTVKVIRDGQEVIINLTDYDPDKHELVGQKQEEQPETPISLEDMTATELKEYAQENDIDITGLRSKADLLAAVQLAEESQDEPTDELDGE